jgi:hypothetical protein
LVSSRAVTKILAAVPVESPIVEGLPRFVNARCRLHGFEKIVSSIAALRRFALIGKSVALIPNQFSAKPK